MTGYGGKGDFAVDDIEVESGGCRQVSQSSKINKIERLTKFHDCQNGTTNKTARLNKCRNRNNDKTDKMAQPIKRQDRVNGKTQLMTRLN